ncbi:MAG TPA: hypothetical protein VFG23_04580 [Polyangia bacterium]|nr:hypothetical protein [Polyangia bacterium]
MYKHTYFALFVGQPICWQPAARGPDHVLLLDDQQMENVARLYAAISTSPDLIKELGADP